MVAIESFNFSSGTTRRTVASGIMESAMSDVVSETVPVDAASDPLAAELEAYNRAFCELELPWRWDAQTFRHLVSVAPDQDFVGAYVERNHAHLLRAYEKAFLPGLVRRLPAGSIRHDAHLIDKALAGLALAQQLGHKKGERDEDRHRRLRCYRRLRGREAGAGGRGGPLHRARRA